MSRKIWIASLFAVLLSLLPNTAQAQWDSEAECEAELFPYSAEETADASFSIIPNASCQERYDTCHSACGDQYLEESAICLVTVLINPWAGLLCEIATVNRLFKCIDRCERLNIDCLVRGGGSAGGGPLNLDPGDGSGGGCGLSAEYAEPC